MILHNKLRFGAKIEEWEFCPSFFRGALSQNWHKRISQEMRLKLDDMEMFSRMSVDGRRKSELRK